MADGAQTPVIQAVSVSLGNDIYAKSNGVVGGSYEFTSVPWTTGMATGTPRLAVGGSDYFPYFEFDPSPLQYDVLYNVYRNGFSATFTVDYGADANFLNCASILSTDLDTLVYVSGSDLPSGLVQGKPYWAINVVNGSGLELEAVQGSGTPVDLGDSGSGTLTLTLASRRSKDDFLVGTFELEPIVGTTAEGIASREEQYTSQINNIWTWLSDGGRTDLLLDAILEDTGTTLPATLAAIQAKTDQINSGRVNTVDVNQTRINITRNDAYDGTANPAITWTVAKDYTSGWTGTFTIRHRTLGTSLLSKSVTVTDATTLTVSLASTDTAFTAFTTDADFGPHPYDIQMVNGTSRQTAAQGPCVIYKDETLS